MRESRNGCIVFYLLFRFLTSRHLLQDFLPFPVYLHSFTRSPEETVAERAPGSEGVAFCFFYNANSGGVDVPLRSRMIKVHARVVFPKN